ncbi:MAG: DUF4846 domain-containing protein, partial [Treponema sp.]|nr:DUF4846 domain-containing protein [Treponema sp.]
MNKSGAACGLVRAFMQRGNRAAIFMAGLLCLASVFPAFGQNDAASRFAPPSGFVREKYEEGSFALYLRQLPLKPAGAVVRY